MWISSFTKRGRRIAKAVSGCGAAACVSLSHHAVLDNLGDALGWDRRCCRCQQQILLLLLIRAGWRLCERRVVDVVLRVSLTNQVCMGAWTFVWGRDTLLYRILMARVTLVSLGDWGFVVAPNLGRLDRLHYGFPMVILQLEIKGFFGSIFNRAVCGCHFIPSEACNHPLKALVRQNLDLQADKLDFLRIGEVSIRLMNHAIVHCPIGCLQSRTLLHE